jgi:hypothetical protein
MGSRIWIAGISSCFALLVLINPAAAASWQDTSDAKWALLGPRIDSGLVWDVQRREDEAICALSEQQVRARTAKLSKAARNAAFDVWSEAKLHCEERKYGISGFHVSVGVGGQFGLDSSTETQRIGSAGIFDPLNLDERKAGLGRSGVVGQFGIGYDWRTSGLFPVAPGPGVRSDGFVGVNFDVTFGGGSKTIEGIPGIIPFLAPMVANTDTLRFRSDVTLDFTGRIGTYVTPNSAIYGLGGFSASSVSFRYDCVGFCMVTPSTPGFSDEARRWTYGGVIGGGFETRCDWFARSLPVNAAASTLYLEYRAHLLNPVTLDVGSINTRSTSQRIDISSQIFTVGARLRF